MTSPVESLARSIAVEAHAGQVDKAGGPYIGHVERVVARLSDPLDRVVGWLHDVLEDTDWDGADLVLAGTAPDADLAHEEVQQWRDLVADVLLLTHRPHEPRADYYGRIRTSPRAVRVKLADVADNSDPARLARLDEETRERLTEKYRKAREALGGEHG